MASLIIASAPVGVVFADRDGVIRIWNEAASQLLGYRSEQALGSRLDVFIPPEHHRRHWAGFQRAIAAGHTEGDGQRLRLPAVHLSGDLVEIEGDFGIGLSEDGQAIGVAALLRRPLPGTH